MGAAFRLELPLSTFVCTIWNETVVERRAIEGMLQPNISLLHFPLVLAIPLVL
jgi:hypothetical protein